MIVSGQPSIQKNIYNFLKGFLFPNRIIGESQKSKTNVEEKRMMKFSKSKIMAVVVAGLILAGTMGTMVMAGGNSDGGNVLSRCRSMLCAENGTCMNGNQCMTNGTCENGSQCVTNGTCVNGNQCTTDSTYHEGHHGYCGNQEIQEYREYQGHHRSNIQTHGSHHGNHH